MKKLTTVALAGALVATASFANASMARLTGLGAGSQFISDVQDVWTLPQVTAANPDATYMEFGPQYDYSGNNGTSAGSDNSIDTPWGGADMTVGPGVLGIWGNRPFTLLPSLTNLPWANGTLSSLDRPDENPTSGNYPHSFWSVPDHSVDVLYGWNLSDSLALGIGLNRGESTRENSTQTGGGVTTKQVRTDTVYGLSLGADLKDLGAINLLQIGLQYSTGEALNEDVSVANVDNKNVSDYNQINLRVAGEIKGDKGKFQRFNVNLGTEGLDNKNEYAVAEPAGTYTESKYGAFDYNLGYAMGMSSEKGIGLGGFVLGGTAANEDSPNFDVANVDSKAFWNELNLKFVTSGEASLKDWLKMRAGFSTVLYGYDYTDFQEGGSDSSSASETNNGFNGAGTTNISLGLSFVFGDLTIDGALNQDILFNGPFATNGIPTQLFSQVSATWAWGAGKE